MQQSVWFPCLFSLVSIPFIMMCITHQTSGYTVPGMGDCLSCRNEGMGAMQNKMCSNEDKHFVFKGTAKSNLDIPSQDQDLVIFQVKVLDIYKNNGDINLVNDEVYDVEVPSGTFCKIPITDGEKYMFSGITRTNADGNRTFLYTDVCLNMNYNIQPEQPFKNVIKNNFNTNYLANCDCTVEVYSDGTIPVKTDDNCIERVDCIECTNFVSYCTRVNGVCQWQAPDNHDTLSVACKQTLGWAQTTTSCDVANQP